MPRRIQTDAGKPIKFFRPDASLPALRRSRLPTFPQPNYNKFACKSPNESCSLKYRLHMCMRTDSSSSESRKYFQLRMCGKFVNYHKFRSHSQHSTQAHNDSPKIRIAYSRRIYFVVIYARLVRSTAQILEQKRTKTKNDSVSLILAPVTARKSFRAPRSVRKIPHVVLILRATTFRCLLSRRQQKHLYSHVTFAS